MVRGSEGHTRPVGRSLSTLSGLFHSFDPFDVGKTSWPRPKIVNQGHHLLITWMDLEVLSPAYLKVSISLSYLGK